MESHHHRFYLPPMIELHPIYHRIHGQHHAQPHHFHYQYFLLLEPHHYRMCLPLLLVNHLLELQTILEHCAQSHHLCFCHLLLQSYHCNFYVSYKVEFPPTYFYRIHGQLAQSHHMKCRLCRSKAHTWCC
ncbi:hypothetical protein OIU74_020566 [Salix koriyanagi]|uniref:Uncharacterized protein n=1 Tax=Salix koriyanagi TaxID=2511006 RepID=A0A9Q0P666_9ROSI|nr:hypothetical protein OIU74_020566 [Salix koriyanagi]